MYNFFYFDLLKNNFHPKKFISYLDPGKGPRLAGALGSLKHVKLAGALGSLRVHMDLTHHGRL
jgi:hypothetical protein